MNKLLQRSFVVGCAVWVSVSCLRMVDFEPGEQQDSTSSGGSVATDACAAAPGWCTTVGSCTSDYDCDYSLEQCVSGVCQARSCLIDSECYPGSCIWEPGISGECRPAAYCSGARPCGGAATCVASTCEPRTCGADADCFPYGCQDSSCTYRCVYTSDCHPDAVCLSDQCVDPACTVATQAKCLGYACDTATLRCYETCGTTYTTEGEVPYGCVADYVCDVGKCRPRCTISEDEKCGGYLCNITTGICGRSCSISSDCASGYSCRSNGCVPQECSDDSACSGYRCVSGECTTTCSVDTDCATSFVCQSGACTQ